jgi:hypothetical protein
MRQAIERLEEKLTLQRAVRVEIAHNIAHLMQKQKP